MYTESLLRLFEKELEQQKVKQNIEEALKDNELNRYKEEYQRLKQTYDKYEERLHSTAAQIDIKKNELSNLQLEKQSYEILVNSNEISSKKKEKLALQVKSINERLSSIKQQLQKLEEEKEKTEKDIMDLKKRISFIKKKYSDIKGKREDQLSNLKQVEAELANSLQEISDTISNDMIEIYKRVKKLHDNPIAFITEKKCNGCNMEVSSMGYEAARYSESLVRCESCGRILIYK